MEGEHVPTTVCVTGASGFIGSWLVMKLLERGYFVRGTVRDFGDDKVKHLVDLPHANTHLSLWKADLVDEGSFDEAVQGCTGVFHVATPRQTRALVDPENEMINPTVKGMLNVMRACCKAKTVKRLVHTSTTGTITVRQHHPLVYDESYWTNIEWCKSQKMGGWACSVGKTMAEKVGWKFAEENGIDLVTIHPSVVQGSFLTPSRRPSAEFSIALIIRNEAFYPWLAQIRAVHVDDVCNAHIFLFEHPEAKGRYLCSSHFFTIYELANSLAKKYPEYDIPTKFEGIDESPGKVIACSCKKLMDLGFEFKYKPDNCSPSDLFGKGIETCKAKGLLPL